MLVDGAPSQCVVPAILDDALIEGPLVADPRQSPLASFSCSCVSPTTLTLILNLNREVPMTTSQRRWFAHLLSPVGFSIIAIGAFQIIATPGPASAAPPPGQTRVTTPQVGAEGGENPVNKTNYGHDNSRSAVPSVVRERPNPPKKGDPVVKLGGQPPMFRQLPRITMPKRSPQSSPMQKTSPGVPLVPNKLPGH